MSADNGVYIGKFKDGYRVIYAAAIDNLDFHEPGSWEEREVWREYWEGAKVYQTKAEALLAAHEMAEEIDILEYGVSMMRGVVEWQDWKGDDTDKDDEAIHDNTDDTYLL